jgi:arginyl-tRNA synthetase
VYVKVNAEAEKDPTVKEDAAKWFKRMEDGDETALKNWRVWREMSIKKYEQQYAGLNVKFDVYTGESEVGQESQTRAVEMLEQMNLVTDHEGAKLVNLEEWKLGKAVLRKKGDQKSHGVPFTILIHKCFADGTSIYLTRDIGGAIERYEKYKFDKMIYVIGSAQDFHTAQFFKMLKLLKYPWADTLEHVNYGMVLGMSTRKGTVVFLDQIIKEAASVMHEQMKKNEAKYSAVEDPQLVARETAITGIKIQDMAAKRSVFLTRI